MTTKPVASAVQVTTATRSRSPVADMNRARELLQRVFGFHAFLPLQETVVRRVIEGGDTLLVMPTGGGKSLCYQLPAMVFDGLTLVVSPLIALMQDQVMQLKQLGVPAAFLNSTLTHAEYVRVTRRVRGGDIKLLYAAPETLVRPETLRLLGDSRLCCIAVDEAHCISEWGHDFRPEYRQLREVRSRFADAVCLALTATATPRVRQDIREQLSIPAQGEFVASFDRPNLYLAVRRRQRGLSQLLAFLEQHRGQSGIIYCPTRRQVDRLSEQLGAAGWPNLPYHAGLEDDVRREHQEQFIRDRVPIMVATIAFGMGINKSDVRFIVHYNLPKNLEHYYQEIGRAGRDGLPAHCLLLYSRSDAITIERFIEEGAENERPGREARLRAMLDYAETTGCRRVPLLGYFGETHPGACGQCDHCVTAAPETAAASAPEPATPLEDVTVQVQKLLSCVHRTGQRFGATHVVDILRGSRSKKVLRWGHDQLSTHGIGREWPAERWRDLVDFCLREGLLEHESEFGGLRLTAEAWKVLRGRRKVEWRPPTTGPVAAPKVAAQHDVELFEELRRLRRRLAEEQGVPPYVVFSDRALVEMATCYPQSPDEFLRIVGVGERKLATYGDVFLECIRNWCRDRAIRAERADELSAQQRLSPLSGIAAKPRYQMAGDQFVSGDTLEKIAERLGVTRKDVLKLLTRYVEKGGKIDAARVLGMCKLSPELQRLVLEQFERLRHRLGPIHEALGGRVRYEDLHLLRLWLLARDRPAREP